MKPCGKTAAALRRRHSPDGRTPHPTRALLKTGGHIFSSVSLVTHRARSAPLGGVQRWAAIAPLHIRSPPKLARAGDQFLQSQKTFGPLATNFQTSQPTDCRTTYWAPMHKLSERSRHDPPKAYSTKADEKNLRIRTARTLGQQVTWRLAAAQNGDFPPRVQKHRHEMATNIAPPPDQQHTVTHKRTHPSGSKSSVLLLLASRCNHYFVKCDDSTRPPTS